MEDSVVGFLDGVVEARGWVLLVDIFKDSIGSGLIYRGVLVILESA